MFDLAQASDVRALVAAVEMLTAETRLRNAQYDNLAAKVDLIVELIARIASDHRRESEERQPQVILPMVEGNM